MAISREPQVTVSHASHLMLRDITLNLDRILETLPSDVLYLHLYCFHLECGSTAVDGTVVIKIPTSGKLRYINIFACNFLSNTEAAQLRIDSSGDVRIRLFIEQTPQNFSCNDHETGKYILSREPPVNISSNVELSNPVGSWQDKELREKKSKRAIECVNAAGWNLELKNDQQSVRVLRYVPGGELRKLDPAITGTKGSIFGNTSAFGNLPLLLNDMFMHACSLAVKSARGEEAAKNDVEAAKYLMFIVRCTSVSSDYQALYDHAARLLKSIQLATRYPDIVDSRTIQGRHYVPLNAYVDYQTQAGISQAEAQRVSDAIDIVEMKKELNDTVRKTAAIAFKMVAETIDTKSSGNQSNYQNMMDKMNFVSKARAGMKTQEEAYEICYNSFQTAIVEYGKKKERERDMAIIKGVSTAAFKLVWGIFTFDPSKVIATAGDITKAIGEAFAEAAADGSGGDKKGDATGKDPAPKSKDMSGAAKKGLLDAGLSLWNSAPTMFNAIQGYRNNQIINSGGQKQTQDGIKNTTEAIYEESGQALQTSSPPIDYINLMAEWDKVQIRVNEMFILILGQLGKDELPPLAAYRQALTTMITQGKTLLSTQKDFQDAMTQFYRGWAESRLLQQRQANILKSAEALENENGTGNAAISDLRAYLQVLLRRFALDLYTLLTSARYRSAFFLSQLSLQIVQGGTLKKTHENLKASFQSLITKISTCESLTHSSEQTTTITLSTSDLDSLTFLPEWKDSLVRTRSLRFQVPTDIEEMRSYWSPRVRDISATFRFKSGTFVKDVTYIVTLGPLSLDFDQDNELHQFHTNQFSIRKTGVGEQWKFGMQLNTILPALPGLCTPGTIVVEKVKSGLPLEDVEEVTLTIDAWVFNKENAAAVSG